MASFSRLKKHILKSKRLFSEVKEDFLLDLERMHTNRDQKLHDVFGLTLSSNTRDLENIKDQKLQAMFLSQVDIGFNQNASTIELSFTGNSKETSKKVLDRVASSLEIINNEKNLEIQSKKARITKTKVEAAKRKLDIINKKIEEFIIAKNFPEEDSIQVESIPSFLPTTRAHLE